jgi:hypothetical protein
MSSSPQVQKTTKSVSRKPFRPEEDAQLIQLSEQSSSPSWERIAQELEGRTARQCRERYLNYLSPLLRTRPWTVTEDEFLIAMVNCRGHAWCAISRMFQGRSENDIKNRWYSHLQPAATFNGCQRDLPTKLLWQMRTDPKKRKRRVADARQTALALLEATSREDAVLQAGPCPSESAQSSEIAVTVASESDNEGSLGHMEPVDWDDLF